MIEKKDSISVKLIYIFLKYLYIFVFLPKYFQMFFITLWFVLMIKEKNFKLKINKNIFPFFLVGIINIVSIAFNLNGSEELVRILATLNTALLWCYCAIIFSFVKDVNIDINKVNKYMFLNIVILFGLACLMIILCRLGINNFTIFSRTLMRTDWLYGVKSLRFRGFLLYDNLVSQLYFLSFPFAYSYILKSNNRFIKTIFLVFSVLPVIMCKSRMGIVLSIFNIGILFPNTIANKKKTKPLIYILYFLILTVLIVYNFSYIYEELYNLINGRTGSNSARMNIYITSITLALNKSPLIGCGIKSMIGNYPLGSHSTYIGLFYKTGILGFICGILGLLNCIKPIKHMTIQYKIAAVCLLVMLITGDLDGENWLIILFGILYGIIQKNISIENKEMRKQ